ncbi:MAG: hypothetical protein KatS3mg012_0444 [Gaiellaceae bacterium]|nr:MAG: hypothetical protein KatS3mg012_0444 [Gaiellaceae bacterium]
MAETPSAITTTARTRRAAQPVRTTPAPAVAHGLPRFVDGRRPDPETPARKALVRGVAVGALLVTFAYLGWRVAFTLDPAYLWVAIPLLVLEAHNALGLGLFTVGLWDVDAGPRVAPVTSTRHRVAVLIPTYNEPLEVLTPTVAAAVALEPACETWILDDGRRPEVAELARELGARYLTRPDNRDAKAGNLNHALDVVDADIVAVLDADHVPGPDFLRNTLGYFDDPSVALVQTPQDFYNMDSFEHERRRGGRLFLEEAVFYRVIAAGKNRLGAAFWCGTSALLRTAALRDVGGVATGSVTEDMHTTIRLHRRGWKSVYHNEVLARGLAPRNASEYLAQRRRWAAGAMQVVRLERPITGPGLTLGQRLGYAATLWAWWDSWRTLGYIVLPIVVVATGAIPIAAPLALFGPLFLGMLGLQFLALRLLARGYYPPVLSLVFEFLRMPAVVPGTLALLRPKSGRFAVTPKGPSEEGRRRIRLPLLMRVLLVAAPAALAWFALTISGLTPLSYPVPGVAVGAAAFLVANTLLLVAAARRIRSDRFATDQRLGTRLPVRIVGSFAGRECTILDVSLSGARVVLAGGPTAAEGGELALDLPGGRVVLDATIERRVDANGGSELGVRFRPGQRRAVADLALALFSLAQSPSGTTREDGSEPRPAPSPLSEELEERDALPASVRVA